MKPVILYTAGTPNGQKVSNFTEELKRAYPSFEVEYQAISLGKNEQKEDWFLAINPNGRIPALKDPNRGDFCVFETAAIILYLEKHYDSDHIFSWSDDGDGVDKRSEAIQWLFFVHGGIGPMQGQANHFVRYAPEDIPYGKNRYVTETKRLYQVLDRRLKDHDWLVGDKYSIADINAYPWLQYYKWAGLKDEDVPQSVRDYIDRNWAREAVREGMKVPNGNTDWVEKMRSPDFFEVHAKEAEEKAAQASKWIQDGMKKDRESKA
ncbi:glutathione S-transferase C-terminal-like protein [Moesziomyces antarcticus]|uniref:Glutathione S-transferase C-terminal-like protein n=2 Tax=Pseudozyma antarctica TaxID=84753 RepID=A0A081CBU6_PSEA2|nr:glutathione S-transferase C-terminal-like protein [Moesziomyces antarcticus]GAK64142.1 glutathione S-transferase C-terminal-like protein [Moesziomyces antarcticus]SPO44638.1 probable theta class glutathione s-transferase [Moesziomyces antarcticus]